MKIFFLSLFMFFNLCIYSNSENTPIENQQTISISYYSPDQWIIQLDDETLWEGKVLIEKRKQTWDEWWNNILPSEWLLDDNYFISPKEWKENHDIQLLNASEEIFPGFDYIIYNRSIDEKAFVKPVSNATLILPKVSYVEKTYTYLIEEGILELSLTDLGNVLTLENDRIWQAFPIKLNYFYLGFCEGYTLEYYDRPDPSFIVELSKWQKGDLIGVYSCEEIDSFPSKKYLLKNYSQDQMLFATTHSVASFFDLCKEYSKKQYRKGYNHGYGDGYHQGRSEGH